MIKMYVKDYCPYCRRAYALLTDTLKQEVEVIDLVDFPERREEMIMLSDGRTTVPQIFIQDTHIGGCDDLFALYESGALKDRFDL